ncbi:MAG: hypothetical protein ACHQ49_05415 [Elusimicrobiota bacterium]
MNLLGARPSRRLEWGALGLIVALFLGLGSRQLGRPGLAHAESYDPSYGMELALDLPPTRTDWSLTLAGRKWPLRVQHPYDFCAFDVYWSALAFKAAGVGVGVLRLSELILSAATLVVLCLLCRSWLGWPAALGAGLLLAVNPAVLLMSRIAYWAVELQLALPAVAALALLSAWQRTRRARALYAGAFVWGFSTCVTTKSAAFILAYPLLYLVLVPRKDYPSRRQAAAAAACAALGAADFLAYNIARGMPILGFMLGALRTPTRAGVDNLAFARNLALRWGQLFGMLDGSFPTEGFRDRLFPAFFFASFAALTWRCVFGRPFRGRGFVVLVLCLLPLLLCETAFTPWALDPQHVLVLWPFTAVVAAAAVDWIRAEVESRRPGRGAPAAAILLVLLAGSALRADAGYFSRLAANGGTGPWSGAVTELAAFLDRSGPRETFNLAPELQAPVSIITGGRVNAISISIDEPPARLRRIFEWMATLPEARVLSIPPANGVPDAVKEHLEGLRMILRSSGRRLALEKTIADGDETKYLVWRVEKRGP